MKNEINTDAATEATATGAAASTVFVFATVSLPQTDDQSCRVAIAMVAARLRQHSHRRDNLEQFERFEPSGCFGYF